MLLLFTRNLFVKIICLLVAAFLWVWVSANQNTVGKFPSSLKVKALNTPLGLSAIYDTGVVDIKVMAEPAIWRKLSADSFSSYIDLSSASAGTLEVPVTVISSVPGVQVVEIIPKTILVSLETIVSKEVNINKKVEGSAAEGLAAGNIALSLEKVAAKGAKSLIDNLSEATVTINLNGETEDFTKIVTLVALDEKGEAVAGIEFIPKEVNAAVSVIKAANNKTVGVKVKTSGQSKGGYFVSLVSVSPQLVDVVGARTSLSEINYIETYAVDISELSGNLERDVGLNVPSSIALQTGTPSKVRVRITVAPSDLSREFITGLSFTNLDPEYRVAGVNPSQVKLTVTGAAEIISPLKPTDFSANFDLSGKTAGVYNLNLSSDNFKLPAAVSAVSIVPSSVSITLEKKGS